MARLELQVPEMDELQQALKDYQGNTENIINDVLHNEASPLIQDAIKRLMPVSGQTWKGKKKAAKSANSLMSVNENLAVTVKTKNAYQYLYFPDDGSNTRRHAGNQHFFERGGEMQIENVKNRIVMRLVDEF